MSTSTVTSERIRPAAAPHMTAQLGPRLWHTIVAERWMYLFIVPGALYFLIFEYLPLLGNVIAFQDFSPFLGISGSPFIGLENFRHLLTDGDFKLALANTQLRRAVATLLIRPDCAGHARADILDLNGSVRNSGPGSIGDGSGNGSGGLAKRRDRVYQKNQQDCT